MKCANGKITSYITSNRNVRSPCEDMNIRKNQKNICFNKLE